MLPKQKLLDSIIPIDSRYHLETFNVRLPLQRSFVFYAKYVSVQ